MRPRSRGVATPRGFGAISKHLSRARPESWRTRRLCDAAGINAKTAAAYDRLLANLFIVEAIPAWTSNRLKRLARTAKRYVCDPGLVSAALRVDVDGAMRDGDLLGRILDSFVMAQVRGEISVSASRLRAYHLRQQQGRHEVDVVLEAANGRVMGVEVKAEAAPTARSARHLAWLRDELGDRFCRRRRPAHRTAPVCVG